MGEPSNGKEEDVNFGAGKTANACMMLKVQDGPQKCQGIQRDGETRDASLGAQWRGMWKDAERFCGAMRSFGGRRCRPITGVAVTRSDRSTRSDQR